MQVIFRSLEIPKGSGNSQSCYANFANTGSPGGFLSIAISLRAIRHIKLWHCLSIQFGLLLKLWQSSMKATQLLAIRLQPFSSMLFWIEWSPLRSVLPCSSSLHVRSNSMFRVWSSLALFTPVISWIHWCEIVWGPLILSMRFMHLYWKASNFFASVSKLRSHTSRLLAIVLNNWI